MTHIKFTYEKAFDFFHQEEIDNVADTVELAHYVLHNKTGPGSDYLGWIDLPGNYDQEEFARIKASAEKIRQDSDVLLVIGIGGSILVHVQLLKPLPILFKIY